MTVYFAQEVGGRHLVKIGLSKNVALRVAQVSDHSGVPLRLAAEMPGSRHTEIALHYRFRRNNAFVSYGDYDLRGFRTEWFFPTESMAAFVAVIGGSIDGPIEPDRHLAREWIRWPCEGLSKFRAYLDERLITANEFAANTRVQPKKMGAWWRGTSRPFLDGAREIERATNGFVPAGDWDCHNYPSALLAQSTQNA